MTTDRKEELKTVLDQEELTYLNGILSLLQDNHDEIQDRLRKYRETGKDSDLFLVLHELDWVSDRTEIMFNLAKKLLNTATENTDKALQLIHN